MKAPLKQKFVIKGGNPLRGELEVKGYKNAAGSILAATLLTEKECIISVLLTICPWFLIFWGF